MVMTWYHQATSHSPESMMATFTYMLMCQYGAAGYQVTANKYIISDKFENLHQRCHHYGYISHVIVHKNIFNPSVPDTTKFPGKLYGSWWRHQIKTFSRLLALCAGNSSVTGEFPSQRPVTRKCDVCFDLHRNKRFNKQSRLRWFETYLRLLWRHCIAISSAVILSNMLSKMIPVLNEMKWKFENIFCFFKPIQNVGC